MTTAQIFPESKLSHWQLESSDIDSITWSPLFIQSVWVCRIY